MAGYGTDVDLKSYWDEAGYTYASDAPFGALRQRGSTYIDATYGERFPGEPTGGIDQERAWPRSGATVYGSARHPPSYPSALRARRMRPRTLKSLRQVRWP